MRQGQIAFCMQALDLLRDLPIVISRCGCLFVENAAKPHGTRAKSSAMPAVLARNIVPRRYIRVLYCAHEIQKSARKPAKSHLGTHRRRKPYRPAPGGADRIQAGPHLKLPEPEAQL